MKKVLIIDDEKNILESVAMYLSGHDFEVMTSMEGIEGIRMAKDKLPDIILLDLILPDMDGYLVCRALKGNSATEDIPIVVISAKSQKEDVEKANECGASDYILKPFEPTALIDVINKNIKENDNE
jgi:DNA-binding response OmpR family regulator